MFSILIGIRNALCFLRQSHTLGQKCIIGRFEFGGRFLNRTEILPVAGFHAPRLPTAQIDADFAFEKRLQRRRQIVALLEVRQFIQPLRR